MIDYGLHHGAVRSTYTRPEISEVNISQYSTDRVKILTELINKGFLGPTDLMNQSGPPYQDENGLLHLSALGYNSLYNMFARNEATFGFPTYPLDTMPPIGWHLADIDPVQYEMEAQLAMNSLVLRLEALFHDSCKSIWISPDCQLIELPPFTPYADQVPKVNPFLGFVLKRRGQAPEGICLSKVEQANLLRLLGKNCGYVDSEMWGSAVEYPYKHPDKELLKVVNAINALSTSGRLISPFPELSYPGYAIDGDIKARFRFLTKYFAKHSPYIALGNLIRSHALNGGRADEADLYLSRSLTDLYGNTVILKFINPDTPIMGFINGYTLPIPIFATPVEYVELLNGGAGAVNLLQIISRGTSGVFLKKDYVLDSLASVDLVLLHRTTFASEPLYIGPLKQNIQFLDQMYGSDIAIAGFKPALHFYPHFACFRVLNTQQGVVLELSPAERRLIELSDGDTILLSEIGSGMRKNFLVKQFNSFVRRLRDDFGLQIIDGTGIIAEDRAILPQILP